MDIPDPLSCIDTYFENVKRALSLVDAKKVMNAVNILETVRAEDSAVWVVGNGGSAATASHFANDLWKSAKIRAISLPDLVPLVTAFGNDNGWENMYGHTMSGMIEPNDILFAISCSGRSKNVVEAVRIALAQKHNVIALTGTGMDSNILAQFDIAKILVPEVDIRVQEDVHMAICHGIITALTW